jgi:hypothetical protein
VSLSEQGEESLSEQGEESLSEQGEESLSEQGAACPEVTNRECPSPVRGRRARVSEWTASASLSQRGRMAREELQPGAPSKSCLRGFRKEERKSSAGLKGLPHYRLDRARARLLPGRAGACRSRQESVCTQGLQPAEFSSSPTRPLLGEICPRLFLP